VGTSKSYGGPGDGPPLLPDWALGDGEPTPNGQPPAIPFPLADTPNPVPTGVPTAGVFPASPLPDVTAGRIPALPITSRPWRLASTAMGKFASPGGSRRELKSAGRKYVRARGGSTRAARASTAGRAATSGIVGFLSDVATRGVEDTLRGFGLQSVLGQPVEEVLAAIVNALAPVGVDFEDIAARRTVDEVLVSVFERFDVLNGGIERLNAMDAAGVQEAFQLSVAEFIFQRWMLELGRRIEDRAMTAREAGKLEREVKAYVIEAAKLDLRGRDPVKTNWKTRESQKIIEDIYREAYNFLES
jgi:hypothetical protein